MTTMDRRRFSASMVASMSAAWAGAEEGERPAREGGLTDVPGVKVGHFTESRRPTGCTAILVEDGAVCGVDARGGAPGTRETDLLDPVNTVQKVHAVVLSGGSAFGLETASGVMRLLEERNVGYPVNVGKVPIVPGAILFDLAVGDGSIRPDGKAGYEAARGATTGPVPEGCVGAGTGASVGKLAGMSRAMKGGLGTASVRLPGDAVVSAIVAVNAVGDVVDPTSGTVLAGVRTEDGQSVHGSLDLLLSGALSETPQPVESSVIGVVATNVALNQAEATRVAYMAHNGLARTIRPVFTPLDGDTLFALSTGGVRVEQPALVAGALAAEAVARAVIRAIRTATSLPGLPAARDLGLG